MEDDKDKIIITLAIPTAAVPALREFAKWLRNNPRVIGEDGPTLEGIVTRYLWEQA